MNVTFDPIKDTVNLAKHGFSLADAMGFEWDTAVVFVDRPPEQPTERRIISLRKANSREVKRYAET